MTDLIHTCFILQYVHYNPLHVSSTLCSSSGGWIVLMQHLVSSTQSERVLSQPVHRTATDWEDDTRCCISRIQPPDDEHVVLETRRGLWWNTVKIKQLCFKLVVVRAYLCSLVVWIWVSIPSSYTSVVMNIWCDNFELQKVTVILSRMLRSQGWKNSFLVDFQAIPWWCKVLSRGYVCPLSPYVYWSRTVGGFWEIFHSRHRITLWWWQKRVYRCVFILSSLRTPWLSSYPHHSLFCHPTSVFVSLHNS